MASVSLEDVTWAKQVAESCSADAAAHSPGEWLQAAKHMEWIDKVYDVLLETVPKAKALQER